MTTARTVPVTTELDGDELDAEDAWHLVRRIGVRRLLIDSAVRFRYGDGFTSSRALALQGALAVVPFLLALSGLAADVDEQRLSRVIAGTILSFGKALGEFGATITFVSNIPGETQTIPTAIYTYTNVPGGDTAAMRLVVISIIISMAALVLSELLARRVSAKVIGDER